MARTSNLILTSEHVTRIARTLPDAGPPPGQMVQTDDDYRRMVASLFDEHRPDDLWVFAYGSLIWRPEFEHEAHVRATAKGWHRAFCLTIRRWRGSPEFPGLMMAMDRGGCCHGLGYRLPREDHAGQIERLLRRETTMKPATNVPRWINVDCADGSRRKMLAMVANPKGPAYAGKIELGRVAHVLARAAGHWGTGAEYLYNTVRHLDEHGIRDRNLWRLQELVAAEIEAMT